MTQNTIPPMPGSPASTSKKKFGKGKLALIIVGGLAVLGIIGSLTNKPKATATSSPTSTSTSTTPTETVPTVAPTPVAPTPVFTVSQENAIASAKSYLDSGAFSKWGLIQQLSSKYGEGFPKADAVFAVDHITVNWNEQAARSAKDYLRSGSFSCQGLIGQLESKSGEGFTHSQAVYGAHQTGLCG